MESLLVEMELRKSHIAVRCLLSFSLSFLKVNVGFVARSASSLSAIFLPSPAKAVVGRSAVDSAERPE
jgi:hypothetical protein